MVNESVLGSFPKIHVVGIGGAGMSGIAKLLASLGHRVTGSDLKPSLTLDVLGDLGIEVWAGSRPDRVRSANLVVRSSAVPMKDPEVQAAIEAGIQVWERPQLLAAFTSTLPAIGFTGTHGKTTSTALAVSALRASGHDPTFLVGGDLVDLNTGAHLGDRDRFVLEADEAFGTFIDLRLAALMITNIDNDHLDFYETSDALFEQFVSVAERVEGPVVVCIDDPGAARLADRVEVATYGMTDDADYRVSDVRHGNWEVSFTLSTPSGDRHDVVVPKPGSHIALNAAGVLALFAELGEDLSAAAAGLADFGGVKRRFEVRGIVNGVTVVDDYAHHPTEIAATLKAARLGSWKTVWAVFQPHRFSRTLEHAAEFGEALLEADRVVLTDIYPAGESPVPGVTSALVANGVVEGGGAVEHLEHLSDVSAFLVERVGAGDLVLLLGAGDVNSIAEPLTAALGART